MPSRHHIGIVARPLAVGLGSFAHATGSAPLDDWKAAQQEHLADGGIYDQIIAKK